MGDAWGRSVQPASSGAPAETYEGELRYTVVGEPVEVVTSSGQLRRP